MSRFLARLAPYRRNIDRWVVVYLAGTAFYPLLRPGIAPDPLANVAIDIVLAAAIWIVPPFLRRQKPAILRLAGEMYLPFLFPLFYAEMEYLGLVFFPFDASLDPAIIRLEAVLFGGQPSLDWSRLWPWPWFHELMEFAYFSYYLASLLCVVLILAARGVPDESRWPALRAFIRDLSATMLVCYTFYTLFPVWGAKYFQAGPVQAPGGPFTAIMLHIHSTGAILGAAFPSSHVAATLVPWYHVWKWFPRHRWWFTTLFVMLSASTVYCRYHYVVDVIGGIALGGLIVFLGEKLAGVSPTAAMKKRIPWPRSHAQAGS